MLAASLRLARVLSLREATAAELAQLTGLQPRTVYRVLRDLSETGWAARGEKAPATGPNRGAARARRWKLKTEAHNNGE